MKHTRHPNILILLVILLMLTLRLSSQAQFTYTTNNGAITITGFTGSGGNVSIPSTINGYPVTAIGDFAFENTALYGVIIPDSVVSIGTAAFYYCYAMSNAAIPSSVTNIGTQAFCACPVLWNIAVDPANPSYASAGGVLFNKTLTTLIQFPQGNLAGSYVISNSVTSIGDDAFLNCYRLTNVTLGNGAINIGNESFKYCNGLTAMTIPDNVAIIGNQAFYGCSSLTNLTIGNRVTSIGDQAFYSCSSLTSLKMGTHVSKIGTSAFETCSHLKNLTTLYNVINIGDAAFRFCSSLTNVVFGNSITNIGDEAFRYCTSLHQVYFQGNAPGVDGMPGNGNSTVFQNGSGTVYYLPGTAGWGASFGGFSTAFWFQPWPQILRSGYGSGTGSNGFKFTISWATNTAVVVEASTNLQNWMPVITNALVKGTNAFSDSNWTNYPQRFYRVHSQ